MRDQFAFRRPVLGAVILAMCLGLVGCAPPIVLATAPATADVAAPATADTNPAPQPPTIELRYFSFSPTVSVVGWTADDAGYGLRTVVRRDGSLVRDHRLYVSTYCVPWVRSLRLAVAPPKQLEMLGISRDTYACYFGSCSPFETLAVRIPDDLLRANRDSVSVKFYGRDNRELIITVRRDLIDAYLARVDSVSATLRKLN